MNELENIINLFNDCDLGIYTNVECNYAEVSVADLNCICDYVQIGHMLHPDFRIYINYEEDLVIFDRDGMEYLGFWR